MNPSFVHELQTVEFCSTGTKEILLDDIFIFPNLLTYSDKTDGVEIHIENIDYFNNKGNQFIIGDSQSGKTKFSAWLCLENFKNKRPCLYFDLDLLSRSKDKQNELRKSFSNQFTGDFDLWMNQDNKCIIFDNVSKDIKCIDFIKYVEEMFSSVLLFVNKDIYNSYFVDDDRFTDFGEIMIKPFCHVKQEEIIKKWLQNKGDIDVNHSRIDALERNINSIIIDNKILPRYPFFILSILQTYESFMPENLKITAYGHCYQALIVARLIKIGINQEDSALESAFTFCSSLAFAIYKNGNDLNDDEYGNYLSDYKDQYILKESVLNRLFGECGILENKNGKVKFCLSYAFYYFLGKYLAENFDENKEKISEMVQSSYAKQHSLIIIFTIHHANDISLIDELLIHTMCVIDSKTPAVLSKEDTAIFNSFIQDNLPEKIESDDDSNIDEERKKERNIRTKCECDFDDHIETDEITTKDNVFTQIFQCNKNIEILSQILKNKTGSLKKDKLSEIVETICDAGLRMASILLEDSNELDLAVTFVLERYKESENYDKSKSESYHRNEIKDMVNFRVMIWVVSCIEKVVDAINKPELKDIICQLVNNKNTPAYHMIKYFYLLDTSKFFDESLKDEFENTLKNYSEDKHLFLNRIISLRTQHYERTHKIKEKYRQSIFSLLKIPYRKPDMKLKLIAVA